MKKSTALVKKLSLPDTSTSKPLENHSISMGQVWTAGLTLENQEVEGSQNVMASPMANVGKWSNTNRNNIPFARDGSDIPQKSEMDEEYEQGETKTSSVESSVEIARSAYSVDSDRQPKASLLLIFSCNFCVENANSSSMYVYSG